MRVNGKTILFGGDLGRFDRPVLPDPTMVDEADYLLVESTYGNRVHEKDDDGDRLADVIRATHDRGGRVVIPAFAIGRVEELIYWIKRLEEQKKIPVMPVYVDSPMAVTALTRYTERVQELDTDLHPESSDEIAPHGPAARGESPDRRRREARHERQVAVFATQRFRTIASAADSKQLTASKQSAIVISSSGMATGGRVLHHLKASLPDPRNTVLLVGFQAEGTRGRHLADGATEIKIHGGFVPVNARVEKIDSMSAHADSEEVLRWLRGFKRPPAMTFLVHGEPTAMEALQAKIAAELRWQTRIPHHRETIELA
jgi:metallo-beta-lactamase family protein